MSRGPAAGPAFVGVVAVAVLAGVMRATEPVLGGPDPFWHWDLGRRIVRDWLPSEDPYSFLTPGREWILNQWGTEAIIGVVDAIGGLPLVAVFAALLVMAAYGHAGWRMWRRAPSLLIVALAGLVFMAGMSNLTLRGNLFTYLLAPLVLAEMQRRDGPRGRVVLPVIALWANLHAGFLLGIATIVVHGVGELLVVDPARRRRLVRRRGLLVAGSLVATSLTPYGPGLLWQSLALSGRGAASGITEWAAPSLTAPTVLPFTILVAIALVGVALSARRRHLPDVLVTVAFALLGASATRNLAPAAIIVGITAAPHVRSAVLAIRHASAGSAEAGGAVRSLDRVVALGMVGLGVLAVVMLVPHRRDVARHVANVPLPVAQELGGADRPVRAHVTSLWAPAVSILGGDNVHISVDGRLELFSTEEFAAANTIDAADPGWLEHLDEWCVTDVVVDATGPAATYLPDVAGWDMVASAAPVAGTQGEVEAAWFQRVDPPPCA